MYALNIFLLTVTIQLITSQTVLNGYKNYTGATLGNINILISAPHGGVQKPSDIESRTEDTLGDYNTLKLATELRDQLAVLFNVKGSKNFLPFLVFNELNREKMDPNRNSVESCANEIDDCRQAYTDYHTFIENFDNGFMNSGGKVFEQGLLIDIHGQSHSEGWIELGYLLSNNELEASQLNAAKSSLRQLASVSEFDIESLIRGPQSLGSILQNSGLDTVPSEKFVSPNGGNYFSGGYISKTYASRNVGSSRLNAVQIELPYVLRKNYLQTGKTLAQAIFQFYQKNGFGSIQ